MKFATLMEQEREDIILKPTILSFIGLTFALKSLCTINGH